MPLTYIIPGPVTVTFGAKTFGKTKSGAVVTIQDSVIPINDDSHPQGAADYIFAGRAVTVDFVGVTWGDAASMKDAGAVGGGKLTSNSFANVGIPVSSTTGGAATLVITDKDAGTWSWTYAAMSLGPTALNANQEATMSVQFTIIPDAAYRMFTTVPAAVATIT